MTPQVRARTGIRSTLTREDVDAMQLVWWLAWGAEYLRSAAQYLSLAWGPMVTNVVGRPGRLLGPASEHARRNLCQAVAFH